mmetsp:Transcript_22791/g.46258  ORF Transcript_22791/g.46258 Transcript_22791/m.46258 type:complete len:97 (+) Transcript_22791:1623-1913(+)
MYYRNQEEFHEHWGKQNCSFFSKFWNVLVAFKIVDTGGVFIVVSSVLLRHWPKLCVAWCEMVLAIALLICGPKSTFVSGWIEEWPRLKQQCNVSLK